VKRASPVRNTFGAEAGGQALGPLVSFAALASDFSGSKIARRFRISDLGASGVWPIGHTLTLL